MRTPVPAASCSNRYISFSAVKSTKPRSWLSDWAAASGRAEKCGVKVLLNAEVMGIYEQLEVVAHVGEEICHSAETMW